MFVDMSGIIMCYLLEWQRCIRILEAMCRKVGNWFLVVVAILSHGGRFRGLEHLTLFYVADGSTNST